MNSILNQAFAIENDVRTWRHHIHAHPEIGMETEKTATFIENVLAEIGIKKIRRCGKTGVLAVIEGNGPGKCIGLRADIDALPVQERNDLPYRSTIPNAMHACGHDVHTACLLGAAKYLYNRRDSFSGSIKLIFQPAEEILRGAMAMIEDGAMQNPKVDAIYMIHTSPDYLAGTIGLRKGYVLASAHPIKITVKGSQGHGAHPHRCVDAIFVTSQIVGALQSIVSREISPLEPAVLSLGKICGGTTSNIIPEYVHIEGTVRALSKETGQHIFDSIKRICESVALAHRASAQLEILFGSPPVLNTDDMYNRMLLAFEDTFKTNQLVNVLAPVMGGDDFSFFMEHAPGAHFRLGVAFKDKTNAPLHSPDFIVDETCLPYGVAAFAALALSELGALELTKPLA